MGSRSGAAKAQANETAANSEGYDGLRADAEGLRTHVNAAVVAAVSVIAHARDTEVDASDFDDLMSELGTVLQATKNIEDEVSRIALASTTEAQSGTHVVAPRQIETEATTVDAAEALREYTLFDEVEEHLTDAALTAMRVVADHQESDACETSDLLELRDAIGRALRDFKFTKEALTKRAQTAERSRLFVGIEPVNGGAR